MANRDRLTTLEVTAHGTLQAAFDGELALTGINSKVAMSSPRDVLPMNAVRLLGRIACGRSIDPMMEIIAEAEEWCSVFGSERHSVVLLKAMRHAHMAIKHAVLARATLLIVFVFCGLVALTVLAHETHNTESIYQNYAANPSLARSPQQSWGYTPVLYDIPGDLKSKLIAFDRYLEDVLEALGVSRNRSGTSSVDSIKLSVAILSPFGLIPLIQFGLSQSGKASLRRKLALRLAAIVGPAGLEPAPERL